MKGIKKPTKSFSVMSSAGSVICIIVGIIWTLTTTAITNNQTEKFEIIQIIPFLGIALVIFGIVQLIIQINHSTSESRFSVDDITNRTKSSDSSQEEGKSKPKITTTQDVKLCHRCGNLTENKLGVCENCLKQ